MDIRKSLLTVGVTCTIAASVLLAAEPSAQQPKTVAEAHPRLATGVLTFARVTQLPENLVLRAEGVELRIARIDSLVNAQPAEIQVDLKNNAHLILDQLATREILLHLAKASMTEKGQDDSGNQESKAIQSYLEAKVLSRVQVSDAEVRQMYESEKSLLGGATLAEMQPHIRQYLLEQKRQQAVTDYIRSLGKSMRIEVAESWLARQSPLARDNPVEKVRDSGKPSLVDFGATGCGPCDMMAPILEELKIKYEGRLNVVFVHVRERQVLGARYDIQNIPVQVFFDKDGNEVFRHVGFFPQEEIEIRLVQMGVTQ